MTKRWYHWGHAWADRGVKLLRKEIAPRLEDFERDGDLTFIDIAETADGANADFDVIMAAPDGAMLDRKGLKYELLKVEISYQWYRENGQWNYEPIRRTQRVANGTLDVAAGRVRGVWTEAGFVEASTVLVAAGAWSSLFLRKHGVSIPQLSVRSTVAATEPMPEIHAGAAADERIAFRRRQDGGYTLAAGGGSQLYVGPDAFRHAAKYFPALRANPFGVRYSPAAPSGYPDSWTTPRDWTAETQTPFERMRVLDPAFIG